MSGHLTQPRICPACGGVNPDVPRDELAEGERYCTPLSCSAWVVTDRLTKQGKKPLRPDGRPNLRSAPSREEKDDDR